MHTKNDILRNTLEQMLADAEDNGREGIQPMLNPEDVKDILHALKLAEPVCDCKENACCADTEGRNPRPIMQNEFVATIDGMISPDYKERFKAEYDQTKIRYDKLHKMLIKAEAGTLDFKPTCPIALLKEQKMYMGRYLYCLEVRAQIEGIDL